MIIEHAIEHLKNRVIRAIRAEYIGREGRPTPYSDFMTKERADAIFDGVSDATMDELLYLAGVASLRIKIVLSDMDGFVTYTTESV